MAMRWLRPLAMVSLAIGLALLALWFLGPPIQPCFPGVGAPASFWCDSGRPAWLASLSPFERFEVEHHGLFPLVGLIAAAVIPLGVELVRRGIRRSRASNP
jgi:hypothetical protein